MGGRLLAAITLLIVATASFAGTSTTGSLRGTVRDSTGALLPGVQIEVTGDDLPSQRVLTDEDGTYRVLLMPPGRGYELSASLDSFETVKKTDVRILLGREATLNIELRPSAAEELTVLAARPLVNVRDTSSSTNITAEQFAALPTRRDFQYLTVLAPGVVMDAEWDAFSPRMGGATHQENDYIIEGVSTRDALTGGAATKMTVDFISEIQVMTGEFPAEYGRATGGIVNVVTRSGTNRLQGSLLSYYEDDSWASETPKRTIRGNTTYDLGRDRGDWGTSLGGPIVRDRAWFFLSYDLRRSEAMVHLVDSTYVIDREEPIVTEEDVYGGKATIALTSSQSITLSAFGNPTTTSGWLTQFARSTPEFSLRTTNSGSTNASLRYEGILGSARVLELAASRHHQETDVKASTEAGRAVPTQQDFSSSRNFYYGGYANVGGQESTREAISARGTVRIANHEIRAGGDYEQNLYEDRELWTQFTYYGQDVIDDDIGEADYMIYEVWDNDGRGSNDITTYFVQDQWQASRTLNLNLGIRWESQTLSSGRGAVLASGRAADGSIVRSQADSITLDDNWAPRLGISWDPTGTARSKLYASAGRFFEAIPLNINVSQMNGYGWVEYEYYSRVPHTGSSWVNPAGSPLNDDWQLFRTTTSYVSGTLNTGPTPIDPETKLQHQDEYSIGGEIQLGSNWVTGVRYVNRQIGDVIEDHHVLNEQGESVDYIISNIGRGAFASEFREPERNYESVELTLQRRMSDRWQLFSSFIWARGRGDYDGLYNYTNFNTGTGPNATFDIEKPEWQKNTYGKLRSDVPYQFKLHGSYSFPFGLTLSEGFMYSAGVPISAVFLGYPLNGVRVVYLLPRGSAGRTPDYFQLDLHADYQLPLASTGVRVAMIVDAFNVTDENEALYVDESMVYRGMPGWRDWTAPSNLDEHGNPKYNPELPVSPYFKSPRVYQPPRSFQVGLKLTF